MHYINSRAMVMTLALQSLDDQVKSSTRRGHRRARRTRRGGADERTVGHE